MQRLSTPRNILILLLITVVFAVLIMGIVQPQLLAASGGLPVLDMRFTYTYDEALNLLTQLGEEGRHLYSVMQLLDTVFPAAYGLSMALALGLLTARLFPNSHTHALVLLLPILAALLDYVENILVATQIAAFPDLSASIISVAAIVTALKWTFLSLGFVALLPLGILWLYMRHTKR